MAHMLARLVLCGVAVLTALSPMGATAAKPRPAAVPALVAPVRLIPDGEEPLSVAGLHPYLGSLELRPFADGLAVVNRLRLEEYLLGLNEVPLSWPPEALKAQAVAARTYALWTLAQPRAGAAATYGFDICASVQCQVFSGEDVIGSLLGFRWARVVQETRGQALLYEGEPILARYHSTSGGRTLDNEQAFEGERSYPYLQGVPSPTERRSPFYRWKVRFTTGRLERILRHAGWWGTTSLIEARTVPSRRGNHYPDVVLEGQGGTIRRTAEELRDVVRIVAPQLFPQRYPSTSPATGRPLPETFPSNRVRIATKDKVVTVTGRGWGHGAGMSQWGAYGMARRGASYAEILDHYYTSVTLGSLPTDETIDVGVAVALPEVSVSGGFSLLDGRGRTLVEHALGTWTFRSQGAGAVAVDPPKGFGVPLEVGIVARPRNVSPGAMRYVKIALSRPARLQLVDGTSERPPALIKGAGVHRLLWIAPRRPGAYELSVVASTGRTQRRDSTRVVVRAAGDRRPAPTESRSSSFFAAAVIIVLVAVTWVALRAAGKIGR